MFEPVRSEVSCLQSVKTTSRSLPDACHHSRLSALRARTELIVTSGRKQHQFIRHFVLAPELHVSAWALGSFRLAPRVVNRLATIGTSRRLTHSSGNCFSSTAYEHSCLGEPRFEQKIFTCCRFEQASVSRRSSWLQLSYGISRFDRSRAFSSRVVAVRPTSDASVARPNRTVRAFANVTPARRIKPKNDPNADS